MKGKGKLLTYWLLREENPQDQIKDGLPSEASIRKDCSDIPLERPADWDTRGVNDAGNCKEMEDYVELFPSPDNLVDSLRGYEIVEESEELHKNVVEWKKQGLDDDYDESVSATEEFHNKSDNGPATSANDTVQMEGSKEGQYKVNSKSRCAITSSFLVSESGMEEECTNL